MSFCLVIIQHGIYMFDIFVWVPITDVWLQLVRFLEGIQNEVVCNFLIERPLDVSDDSYPEIRSYASCKSDEESMVSFHKCESERSYYSPFICTVRRRISLGTTWRHLVLGFLRLCPSRSDVVCYVPFNNNLLASLSGINLCRYLCRNVSFIYFPQHRWVLCCALERCWRYLSVFPPSLVLRLVHIGRRCPSDFEVECLGSYIMVKPWLDKHEVAREQTIKAMMRTANGGRVYSSSFRGTNDEGGRTWGS
jgi:hypothetical protein